MNYLTIIKYVVTLFAIVYAIFSTIWLFIQQKRKNRKLREAGEHITEEKAFFDELNSQILDAMNNAEIIYNKLADPLGTKLPDMKKTEVLREVKDFYEKKGKTFDIEYISAKIEEFIKFSKQVNAKPAEEVEKSDAKDYIEVYNPISMKMEKVPIPDEPRKNITI